MQRSQNMTIQETVDEQKKFFSGGSTRCVEFRKEQLKRLYKAVSSHTDDIARALLKDLSRAEFETYATETGSILSEIRFMISHVSSWSKLRRVPSPLVHFPASSRVYADPYGTVLIMSPWNYPFMLSLEPLVDAIAAGNTAVLKPSSQAPASAELISRIISETFPPSYVTCILGDHETNDELLSQHFDFIFFTGSATVGKRVMKAAAENLTPVCLELGGKNPCIIDETADIALSAKRIVWAKYMNAGQTCVAPDYVLIHEKVLQQFTDAVHKEIVKQYGSDPLHDSSLAKIINEKHFNRLLSLAPNTQSDKSLLKIAPAVINAGSIQEADTSDFMKDEIFGPILPLFTYRSLTEVISFVSQREKPLALYLFSTDRHTEKLLISTLRFGSGAVNDAVVQLATPFIPFGGVGESGMGSYHGKAGFDTFTHYKGLLHKSNMIDISIRYPPYDGKLPLLKRFLH